MLSNDDNYDVEFCVAPKIEQVILGVPFLQKYGGIVDFQAQALILPRSYDFNVNTEKIDACLPPGGKVMALATLTEESTFPNFRRTAWL